MKWKEIVVHTTSEAADLVASVFEDNNLGVAILDSNDLDIVIKNKKYDFIDEKLLQKSDVVLVKGFLPLQNFESGYLRILDNLQNLKTQCQGTFDVGSLQISIAEIEDTDWLENWKKYYKKIYLDKVCICPVWEKFDGNETVIKIEPGMAFGTGEHETTSLCILMMQKTEIAQKDIIDVGCGSGILGICAEKLGAKSVYMCDIDEVAVESAKKNAKLNECTNKIVIEKANLLEQTDKKADVIVANIVAEVLVDFSQSIKNHCNKNAKIILSGIIDCKVQKVVDAYQSQGFHVKHKLSQNGWNCIMVEL